MLPALELCALLAHFGDELHYRREDAKEKKATMETYWVPGVNNHGQYGCWAFANLTEVYEIESDFEAKVEAELKRMIGPFESGMVK